MKCYLSEDELSLLSTPEGFVVTKVQTFEKKDSLKIKNNKNQRKKHLPVPFKIISEYLTEIQIAITDKSRGSLKGKNLIFCLQPKLEYQKFPHFNLHRKKYHQ